MIGISSPAYVFLDHVVCESCYSYLIKQNPPIFPASQPQNIVVDPDEVVPCILANFDRCKESTIATVENELLKALPDSEDLGLLYALRISTCLPKIVKMETLASRFNTACLGAGNRGMLTSKQSKHYQIVHHFLSERFLANFKELADKQIKKAADQESRRRTKQAKSNCWIIAREKIHAGKAAFEHKLSGLDEAIEALDSEIQSRIEQINCE
jgi:hypothetical protein